MPLIVLPSLHAVDFMAEAKEVIGLTTLLSSLEQTSEDDAVSQEVLRIVDKELNIVFKHFQELPVDCVICSALRTRLEHGIRLIHIFLMKVCFQPIFPFLLTSLVNSYSLLLLSV